MIDLTGIHDFLAHMSTDTLNKVHMASVIEKQEQPNTSQANSHLQSVIATILATRGELPAG